MVRTAKRTPLIHAGRAFVLALAAGLVLVGCMEWSRRNQERDRMGYVASAIGAETYEFMLSEMSKTRVLEAYLIQTSGDYSTSAGSPMSCCGGLCAKRPLRAGRDRGRCLSPGGKRGCRRAEHVWGRGRQSGGLLPSKKRRCISPAPSS